MISGGLAPLASDYQISRRFSAHTPFFEKSFSDQKTDVRAVYWNPKKDMVMVSYGVARLQSGRIKATLVHLKHLVK